MLKVSVAAVKEDVKLDIISGRTFTGFHKADAVFMYLVFPIRVLFVNSYINSLW